METFCATFGKFKSLEYLDKIILTDVEKKDIFQILSETNDLYSKISKIENRKFKIWNAENMKNRIIELIDSKRFEHERVKSTLKNFVITKRRILINLVD